MFQFSNVPMFQCSNVPIFQCANFQMSNAKYQMSNVNLLPYKVKLLAERTFGVPPVIFNLTTVRADRSTWIWTGHVLYLTLCRSLILSFFCFLLMLWPRVSSFLAELWDLHDKGGCGLHMFEIRTIVVQFTLLYMCHASSKLGVPHLQALELETNVRMMT